MISFYTRFSHTTSKNEIAKKKFTNIRNLGTQRCGKVYISGLTVSLCGGDKQRLL